MRSLLSTTALIAPFLIGAALAQDAPATEPADPPLEEQVDETLPDTESEDDDDLDLETDLETDVETEDTFETEPVDDAAAAAPTFEPQGEAIVREQASGELRVDWITGTRVYSRDGESIGRITDLIFDEGTNTITVAILSVGGFLGIGAKDIAVKFDELTIDFDAREIRLDLTREAADAAPEYIFRARAQRPVEEPADTAPDTDTAPLD